MRYTFSLPYTAKLQPEGIRYPVAFYRRVLSAGGEWQGRAARSSVGARHSDSINRVHREHAVRIQTSPPVAHLPRPIPGRVCRDAEGKRTRMDTYDSTTVMITKKVGGEERHIAVRRSASGAGPPTLPACLPPAPSAPRCSPCAVLPHHSRQSGN